MDIFLHTETQKILRYCDTRIQKRLHTGLRHEKLLANKQRKPYYANFRTLNC